MKRWLRSAGGERANVVAVPGWSRRGLVTRGELWGVGLFLFALSAVALAWHVVHGGFYLDDWGNAARYRFEDSPRYPNDVAAESRELGSRPILAALLPIPHALFDGNIGAHLALAAVLAAVMCIALFVFLREAGLAFPDALILAVLVFLFPWADSIRLLPTWSVDSIAVSAALLGATLSLRQVGRSRPSLVARSCALALFVGSVLTYEMAAGALLLLGLLYRARAPRGRANRWWSADAVVILAALAYEGLTTTTTQPTIPQRIGAIPTYARESAEIFSLSFVPYGVPGGALIDACELIAFVAVAAVLALGVRRYRRERDRELGRWLVLAAAGIVSLAAGYALLLGTYLRPALPGDGNRVNLVGAIGYSLLAYSVLRLAALLAGAHGAPARRFLAVALVALLVAGYAVRFGEDELAWDRAARLQQPVLSAARKYSTALPRGSAIFTFGVPGAVPYGIPIFTTAYDLTGALRLATGDVMARAYPVFNGVELMCRDTAITARFPPARAALLRVSYRSLYFLDVVSGRRARVASRAACLNAIATFPLAPRDAS